MAFRTTPPLVRGILDGVDPRTDLKPYIEAANLMVTGVCTPGLTFYKCGSATPIYTDGFEGSTLELIERWLSAHFYCVYDPRFRVQQAADFIQESIETKVDTGLEVTRYGQMAKKIDFAGYLAALENSQKDVKAKLPAAGIPIRATYLGRRARYPYYPFNSGAWWGI